MQAKFISFEGIEGSGKSTQAKKLYEFFLSKNIPAVLTREPGGTEAGEQIRKILLDGNIDKLEAKTELLLNFAARIEHVEKFIKPALQQGKHVICDRFFDSTYAYQGTAFGLDKKTIDALRQISIDDFAPDISFLIDLDVEVAFQRIAARSDNNRYELLGLDFHRKVRAGFLDLAKNNHRIIKIDGEKLMTEIFSEIVRSL